jgi:hypothetical protein
LKLTGDDRLIEGPEGSEGFLAYYHNDMSWALNMKCGETRVYQGWWGEAEKGEATPYNTFAYHEWTKLGEGYNLWDALDYAIKHTTDPEPRENLRFMGQGDFLVFRIE